MTGRDYSGRDHRRFNAEPTSGWVWEHIAIYTAIALCAGSALWILAA